MLSTFCSGDRGYFSSVQFNDVTLGQCLTVVAPALDYKPNPTKSYGYASGLEWKSKYRPKVGEIIQRRDLLTTGPLLLRHILCIAENLMILRHKFFCKYQKDISLYFICRGSDTNVTSAVSLPNFGKWQGLTEDANGR